MKRIHHKLKLLGSIGFVVLVATGGYAQVNSNNFPTTVEDVIAAVILSEEDLAPPEIRSTISQSVAEQGRSQQATSVYAQQPLQGSSLTTPPVIRRGGENAGTPAERRSGRRSRRTSEPTGVPQSSTFQPTPQETSTPGALTTSDSQIVATEIMSASNKETLPSTIEATNTTDGSTSKNIRLNFRGVPLELVLDYLSEAAGFIIRPEVDVKGRIDVWSAQPLTPEEAIDALNSALAKQGYAVIREGRTLIVVTRDEAKRRYLPVVKGSNPESIPKTDEVVTQIIPVRFLNAVQLLRDLQPLIPPTATITANEGGNALIVTDTRTNIRRLAEIIRALDTSVSTVTVVRVFQLQYADAKSLANIIQSIFQQSSAGTSQGDIRARFFARFFGGPGGMGGGPQAAESESGTRIAAMRVAAAADERSNCLVVSAPEDIMETIEELIKSVDVNVEDVTELRVFKLKNADPTEMAELIMSLFPDQASQQGQQRGMGRFFAGPPQFQQVDQTTPSQRTILQTRVIAVPDPRTGSVVVTASRNLMPQIEKMITELDADAGRKQKVFVFDVENTDPLQVQSVLQSLFPANTTTGTRAASQTTSQLSRRANQAVSGTTTGTRTTTGFGTGLGTSSGIGRTTTR